MLTAMTCSLIRESASTPERIEGLKRVMQGKSSVFSGQSGVGKSHLISQVTGLDLLKGQVVKKTSKGSHTTSRAHLLHLGENCFCIDTPGIKSFGLWDVKSDEVKNYFSEIDAQSTQCKFPDCRHIDEPDCAVKAAVEQRVISPLRFASYCALMMSLKEEQHGRR